MCALELLMQTSDLNQTSTRYKMDPKTTLLHKEGSKVSNANMEDSITCDARRLGPALQGKLFPFM